VSLQKLLRQGGDWCLPQGSLGAAKPPGEASVRQVWSSVQCENSLGKADRGCPQLWLLVLLWQRVKRQVSTGPQRSRCGHPGPPCVSQSLHPLQQTFQEPHQHLCQEPPGA
jgi:hypothetical protein